LQIQQIQATVFYRAARKLARAAEIPRINSMALNGSSDHGNHDFTPRRYRFVSERGLPPIYRCGIDEPMGLGSWTQLKK
jgi:hypothetical protein